MEDYIDREKLKRDLIDNKSFYPAIVKRAIEEAPTEDVVPRSQLDKFIQEIDQIQKDKAEITYLKEQLIAKAKQEVAREIFDGIEYYLNNFRDNFHFYTWWHLNNDLTELKKKYIGE